MGTITRGLANSITTGGKVVSTSLSGTIQASNVNNESLDSVTAFDSSLGDFVELTASDVSASPTTKGQLFYNTTDGVLKGVRLQAAAWAAGGAASTAREARSAEGTQTATVLFGGADNTSSPYALNNTEHYDGSSWTNSGALNTARTGIMSFGTGIPSAVAAAGTTDAGPATPHRTTATEEYNGSSWTNATSCSTARFSGSGFGVETAGAICGGSDGTRRNDTEEYDGSSWTSGGNLPSGNSGLSALGTQTSGLAFGGSTPSLVTATIEYNGTAWSSTPANLPTGGANHGKSGTQSLALGFGGYAPGVTDVTLEYDGTSWAVNPATLATARGTMGGTGNTTSALASCGVTPSGGGKITNTEEFTNSTMAVKTITTA